MERPQPYQRALNFIAILLVGGLGVALLLLSNNGNYILDVGCENRDTRGDRLATHREVRNA